jgi:glycosyltransferase involved in cell wall biosynthesis
MKILIKSFYGTYEYFQNNRLESHCSTYYTLLFRDIFRKLGHKCDLFGKATVLNEIVKDYSDYDMILFWGLESFLFDLEFSKTVLQNFKGKKCLYITAQSSHPLISLFDYIFPCEINQYKQFYESHYPSAKVCLVNFASPLYDFVDADTTNPFTDNTFKTIYTGIITGRSKQILNQLVEKGINLYVGGIYAPPDGSSCRHVSKEEMKNEFHPKIHWLTNTGNFSYGLHFKYLKYADVGLNFYPSPHVTSIPINSKIIDYLVCGLPIVSENVSPNNFRITDLNAGEIVQWYNIEEIYNAIQKIKASTFNRTQIKQTARQIFDPLLVGQAIIEEII